MFTPYSRADGGVQPFEYLPVTSGETIVIGEALKLTSGKLTKQSGDAIPLYISMGSDDHLTDDDLLPVIRVTSDQVYRTTLAADNNSVDYGYTGKIHTDGLTVAATGSYLEIVGYEGQKAGDAALVRFREP